MNDEGKKEEATEDKQDHSLLALGGAFLAIGSAMLTATDNSVTSIAFFGLSMIFFVMYLYKAFNNSNHSS